MRRTQIYLSEREAEGVAEIVAREKSTQSAVIRRAIDELLAREQPLRDRRGGMRAARGMWRDRQDFPDVYEERLRSDRRERLWEDS
jgi:hypothetical protein